MTELPTSSYSSRASVYRLSIQVIAPSNGGYHPGNRIQHFDAEVSNNSLSMLTKLRALQLLPPGQQQVETPQDVDLCTVHVNSEVMFPRPSSGLRLQYATTTNMSREQDFRFSIIIRPRGPWTHRTGTTYAARMILMHHALI